MDAETERHYRALNLDPSASAEQIKQAYEDLIRVWDPQRFANSPRLEAIAEDKLNEIIEAYKALKKKFDAAPAADPAPPIADHNVLPAAEEPATLAQPLWVFEPPAEKPAPPAPEPQAAPATPEPVIGNLQEAEAPAPPPRRSSSLLLIGAGAAAFGLLLGGGMFLYEGMTGPRPAAHPSAKAAAAPAAEPEEEESAEPAAPRPLHSPRQKSEPAPSQLASGSDLIAPQGRPGAGKFRITNNSGQEVVVRVSAREAPAAALRLVYVRPSDEVNITGIGPGVYLVSFSLGPLTGKPRTFAAPVGPFQFVQIQSTGGIESDEYRLVIPPQK